MILDSGGSLVDAVSVATYAALHNTRIPKLTVLPQAALLAPNPLRPVPLFEVKYCMPLRIEESYSPAQDYMQNSYTSHYLMNINPLLVCV